MVIRAGHQGSPSITSVIIFLLLSTFACLTTAIARSSPVKRASLIVSEVNVTVNGNTKPIVVINGSYPGPELRFFPGDIVLINVTNAMEKENTTIHWHGLSQRQTPYADGTPLSQWPIAPGKWFEYQMQPTEDDIGTRFYHSHVKTQSVTATGPLIIVDPNTPLSYDREETLLITDYWNKDEHELLNGLESKNFTWIGTPNVTLVNGKGISPDLTGEPYFLDVDYDETHYLRFIGAQSLMYYQFSLFNHTLNLVDVDGTYVKSVRLDSLEIASGQRLGALLHAKSEDEVNSDGLGGCYWMRIESQYRTPANHGWMVVRYPGGCQEVLDVPVSNNTAAYLPPSVYPWVSDKLEPLSSNKDRVPPADGDVTRRIILWAQQVLALHSDTQVLWPINGVVYNETIDAPDEPYMIRLYTNATNRPSYDRAMSIPPKTFGSEDYFQRSWDPISKTWTAKAGEVIDIVIVNNGSAVNHKTEFHPWHFHSSKSWHMASGIGNFSEEAYAKVKASGAFAHPILKDTVTVYKGIETELPKNSSGGWAVLRYRVTAAEAGVWPLHCHLASHLALGMATNFAIAPDEISRQLDLYKLADPNYFVYGQNVRSPYTMAQSRDTDEGSAR